MHAPAWSDEPAIEFDEEFPARPVTGVVRVPAALRRGAEHEEAGAEAGLREPGERDAIVPEPPA